MHDWSRWPSGWVLSRLVAQPLLCRLSSDIIPLATLLLPRWLTMLSIYLALSYLVLASIAGFLAGCLFSSLASDSSQALSRNRD